MQKTYFLLALLSLLTLTYCTTTKQTTGGKLSKPSYTYTADIAPIIQERCTPCHFPETGKKKFLDTYGAVSTNINDILRRVQLPQDSVAFMPFKSKKEPLSDSLIMVFKVWKEEGMVN